MAATPIRTIATVVHTVEPAGRGIVRLELRDPDGWELPRFKPGAHLDLHLPGEMVRSYSLCGDPAQQGRYVLGVKREDAGRGGSRYVCDALRPGMAVGVSLPRGGIELGAAPERHVMVAGGIGVTPFLSAAAALEAQGGRDFVLHVISRGAPPFARELADWVAQGRVVLHDTARGARPGLRALVGAPDANVRVACCGSASLVESFEQAVADWPGERVHIERFVPPPLRVDPDARPYTLVLAKSGVSADVPAGQTVLGALRGVGVKVEASCEGGICGACKVPWLEGAPLHGDRVLSVEQRRHFLMACVATCASERLVLDL